MQTHVAQLTKQRLSDFFVKEDGHVAHKNALVAGTVATGAVLASMLLVPDPAAAHHGYPCGDAWCDDDEWCMSGQHQFGGWWYDCL